MSEQINYRMLPQNVRMATEEAYDFGLEQDCVYICDRCHVFLLNEERALNHKECRKSSPFERKNFAATEKHISESIRQQLSLMENNKNDVVTKKYGVFPSTSNQSYTPVCINGQCVEVVDDSHCGPDDATSVIELNKQKISILFNDEIAHQLTACEKITIAKQSKLIKTSTPQEALLEVPTTSTFTKEVHDPFNEPTFQSLSCYSMMESFKNEINNLKMKHAELNKKVNNGNTDKMEELREERDYFKLLYLVLLKENLEIVNDQQSSKRKIRKLKKKMVSDLKKHSME